VRRVAPAAPLRLASATLDGAVTEMLVGRDVELEAVVHFLASTKAPASLLAIESEPGMGKTTLWREALLRSGRARIVLSCQPARSEAALSYSALADLLSAVDPSAFSTLPSPQREALEVALLRAKPTRRASTRRAVGTALVSLLQGIAIRHPVLIAVDDEQWLDSATVSVLSFALRRLRDAPLRVLVTRRTDVEGTSLADAFDAVSVEHLPLRPLSAAALHEIISSRVGLTLRRPLVVRIAQLSGGNPFYALEIAATLARDGVPSGRDLPVPDDMRALVARRIRALPAATQDALLHTAIAAHPSIDFIDAAALAAAEEIDLVRIADDGRIHFTHPLYASAVDASAPLVRRRQAHRELASSVSNPEERARHLALGTSEPDDAVAEIVVTAARLARGRGAPDAAAELSELAVRLSAPESPAFGERKLELAQHLHLTGDLDGATRLLEELAASLPAGDLKAGVLLHLSGLVYQRAGESRAAAVAREALAVARAPMLQARCHAVLAGWAGTQELAEALKAALTALQLLDAQAPDADPAVASFALANRIRADLFLGNGFDEAAAKRALELEQAAHDPPASVDDRVVYKLGQWLRYVDELGAAREHLGDAYRTAIDEGDESSRLNILLNQLLVEIWAGELAVAEEVMVTLGETAVQLGVPHPGDVWQTYLDAHLGRLELVRERAAGADRQEPIVDMLYLRSLGAAELAAGENEAADRDLERAGRRLEEIGFREPAVWRVEADRIEAAVEVGDTARADRLTTRFERQAERSQIPWNLAAAARSRGILAAASGDTEGATSALTRALMAHERCPVPFERARTLLVLGRVHRRAKRKRLANEALTAALGIFEDVRSELWAERARSELQRVGTRRAPESLTPTERQIAQLAAEGLTNKSIAATMFVSTKTVEANLSRTYRKLGISARAQLDRALTDAGLPRS
jgi:DNA-binding CsgD family transcriptional regulator